MHKHRGRNSTR